MPSLREHYKSQHADQDLHADLEMVSYEQFLEEMGHGYSDHDEVPDWGSEGELTADESEDEEAVTGSVF